MTLFLECKPDETLAFMLGVQRRAVVHRNGKGEVCNRLAKSTGAIGLVDEDPGSAAPGYFKQLKCVLHLYDLQTLADNHRRNRIVVLRPRFEEWLVKTCKQSGLKLEDFGLSVHPLRLHAELNERLENLRRLLGRLLELESSRLLALQRALQC